ncbi:hypothetical protein [Vibrio nomapromontoriensis]|uniref:hypothetical protein n=1 Tax=Vibrio nomapromontoriensis TaxID=2910246 RepID=UPI003D0BDBBA
MALYYLPRRWVSLNGWRAGIEAEVGYAFDVGVVDIKPYATLGVATQGGELRYNYIDTDGQHILNDIEGGVEKLGGAALTGALGVRVNTPIGIYVDTRIERAPFKKSSVMKDNTQGTVTVGFKF